jgi:hypothetical protein
MRDHQNFMPGTPETRQHKAVKILWRFPPDLGDDSNSWFKKLTAKAESA